MFKKIKNLDVADRNLYLLCITAFFMCSLVQYIWIAMPFVAKALGATDAQVGIGFAANMGIYAAMCVLAAMLIGKLRAKNVLLITFSVLAVLAAMFVVIIKKADSFKTFASPVVMYISIVGIIGLATAFVWPTLMGWASVGFEGKQLNRRLSMYNMGWASAAVLAPLIGGYLAEVNNVLPVVVAAAMAVMCIIVMSFTVCVSRKNIEAEPELQDVDANLADKFRLAAKLGLFASYFCIGILRSNLGLLMKFELNFSESYFGWAMAMCLLANYVVFDIQRRCHKWHYKKILFFAANVTLIVSMIIIPVAKTFMTVIIATVLSGLAGALLYSSNMFYGVSGKKNRSRAMAVHEIILAGGFCCGALASGYLSDNFNRLMPYKFSAVLVMLLIIAEVCIFLWPNRKNNS